MKEFNELLQNTVNLKKKIENEISEIDKLFDKVNNEVSKSFEKKHEKLIFDENKLKEKLQNEVTKIKEKLEYSLSESNELIKKSEKLNKGYKCLENEEEKNIIKNLSYVSKMNKNKDGMKKIIGELMRSLKIFFDEDKTENNYEEYYFNGIQIPKNIMFKTFNNNSVEVGFSHFANYHYESFHSEHYHSDFYHFELLLMGIYTSSNFYRFAKKNINSFYTKYIYIFFAKR